MSSISLQRFYFLLTLFIYSFVSGMFVIVLWSVFVVASLKSLSDNSNICAISLLRLIFFAHSSCDFSCSWYDEWLFSLYLEYFGYYVMRFWILLYLMFLRASSDTALQWQGKGVLLLYCQVGVEVQVPPVALCWHSLLQILLSSSQAAFSPSFRVVLPFFF